MLFSVLPFIKGLAPFIKALAYAIAKKITLFPHTRE